MKCTKAELAQLLGVTSRTIEKMWADGRLSDWEKIKVGKDIYFKKMIDGDTYAEKLHKKKTELMGLQIEKIKMGLSSGKEQIRYEYRRKTFEEMGLFLINLKAELPGCGLSAQQYAQITSAIDKTLAKMPVF